MYKRRNGSALGILVLMIVVVVAFVFYIGGDPLDLFRSKIKTDSTGQLLPWNEEKRIVAKDSQVQPPSSSQVPIEQYLEFKGQPQDSNQARGEIEFVVD